MLSYTTSCKLANLLKHIGESEQEIEQIRQHLAAQTEFDPYLYFNVIKKSQSGIFSIDIQGWLAEHHIHYTIDECNLILRRYNTNNQQYLTYYHYLEMILPKNNPFLRAQATQRANQNKSIQNFINTKIIEYIVKLLDK